MRLFLFISALVAFALIACDKATNDTEEKTGTVELVFKARYDGAPLLMYTDISTGLSVHPKTLTFKKLEFFISKVIATKGDDLLDLLEVGYVTFTNLTDATGAETGYKVTITDVPVGTYSKLQYGVGLPDAVNNTEPGDYSDSSNPLSLGANYWASWNSYIFCKIEGDASLTDTTSAGFLYHAGVNGMYQTRSFDKEFTVDADASTEVIFHLHAQDLFFQAGQEIDVLNENSTHSGAAGSTAYILAERAITNLADALHVH